jgi:hypothetical protein
MTYKDRKILLIQEDWTINSLVREYKKSTRKPCRREEMSQCIRGVRTYQPLRNFLCGLFNKTEDELFGTLELNADKAA